MTKNKGFSLIEILIASAILGSVLVALTLLMGTVIRSDSQARNRVMAGDLAQSGADFLRQERNVFGFGRFQLALEEGEIYCLADISQSFLDDEGNVRAGYVSACDDYTVEVDGTAAKFKREAEVQTLSADQITFLVTTSWLTDVNNTAEVATTLQLRPR